MDTWKATRSRVILMLFHCSDDLDDMVCKCVRKVVMGEVVGRIALKNATRIEGGDESATGDTSIGKQGSQWCGASADAFGLFAPCGATSTFAIHLAREAGWHRRPPISECMAAVARSPKSRCPTRNFHALVTEATKPGCQPNVARVASLTQALSCLHYPLDFPVRSCTEVRSNRLN